MEIKKIRINSNNPKELLKLLDLGVGIKQKDLEQILKRTEQRNFKDLNEFHSFLINYLGKSHLSNKKKELWKIISANLSFKKFQKIERQITLEELFKNAADERDAYFRNYFDNLLPVLRKPVIIEEYGDIQIIIVPDKDNIFKKTKSDLDGDILSCFTLQELIKVIMQREIFDNHDDSFSKLSKGVAADNLQFPMMEILLADTFGDISQCVTKKMFKKLRNVMANWIGRMANLQSMMCLFSLQSRIDIFQKHRLDYYEIRAKRNYFHQCALDFQKNFDSVRYEELVLFEKKVKEIIEAEGIDFIPQSWKKEHQNSLRHFVFNPKGTWIETLINNNTAGYVPRLIWNALRTVDENNLESEIQKWQDSGKIGKKPELNKFAVFDNFGLFEIRPITDYLNMLPEVPHKDILIFGKEVLNFINLILNYSTQGKGGKETDFKFKKEFMKFTSINRQCAIDFAKKKALTSKIYPFIIQMRGHIRQQEIKNAIIYSEWNNKRSGRKTLSFELYFDYLLQLMTEQVYHEESNKWVHKDIVHKVKALPETSNVLKYVKPLWEKDKSNDYFKKIEQVFENLDEIVMLKLVPSYILHEGRNMSCVIVRLEGANFNHNNINNSFIDNMDDVIGVMLDCPRYSGNYLCNIELIPGKTKGGTINITPKQKI